MKSSHPLITMRNVSRQFTTGGQPVSVLQNISLSIHTGEMVAIVGPSGSGKSTLMNILGCLDTPDKGEVYIAGVNTLTATADQLAALRSKNIGFIFQRYHLMPYLTAVENVAVPAQYTVMQESERHVRAVGLLSRLGLTERMLHRPSQLSGGQQQRVSIARALMNGANIILADEPTGALDAKSGKELMDILHGLHRSGHTIIIVTHDHDIACQAQRIIEISDGEIVADRPSSGAQQKISSVMLPVAIDTGRAVYLQSLRGAFNMAWRALSGHRIRALLSMLGMIIGVASVITSMAVGEGAKQKIIHDISELGTSTLSIRPGLGWDNSRTDLAESLSLTDVLLLSKLPYVLHASPIFNDSLEAESNSHQMFFNLTGVNAQYFAIRGLALSVGRGLSEYDIEMRAPVLVVDTEAANTLFPDKRNPVGERVNLNGNPFTIVGVTAPKGINITGGGLNAWVAYTALQERLTGRFPIGSIELQVREGVSLVDAQHLIEAELEIAHGRRDFFIKTDDMMLGTIQKTSDSLTLLIAAIAGISLIVGGVGVMNIMLVSVTERTHEIGIRLAVGARATDIMCQFLVESVVVCLFGCAIGIAITFLGGQLFSLITQKFTLVFTWLPIFFSCCFSALIGLGFGFFPARSAARLKPTEALARE